MMQLGLLQQQITVDGQILNCTILTIPAALSVAAASGRLLEYKRRLNTPV